MKWISSGPPAPVWESACSAPSMALGESKKAAAGPTQILNDHAGHGRARATTNTEL